MLIEKSSMMLYFREVMFGENHYGCFMKGTLECEVMKVGLIAKKGGTAENVFSSLYG